MLDDIVVTPLAQIETAGGDVLHAMKSSELGYAGYGEAYFSRISNGSIKAWKRHTRMIMNLVVPVGMVRFVFHLASNKPSHDFRIIEIGVDKYERITVPPGVWFGFQGLGNPQNLILNISSIPHDPDEVERKSINEITFDWKSFK